MRYTKIATPHGHLNVSVSGKPRAGSATILFIHGNSSDSRIWHPLLSAFSLSKTHRTIIWDLPGHGESSDAPDPQMTYTMTGYAQAAVDVLKEIGPLQDGFAESSRAENSWMNKLVVMGWSLGGHIAIELIPLLPAGLLKGIMIVGTPPALGIEQTSRGFKMDVHMTAAAKDELTEEEKVAFAQSVTGGRYEEWFLDAVSRTDPRARKIMWDAFNGGKGVDQCKTVKDWGDGYVGVVNGRDEPFVNLEYLDDLVYGKLWEGKCTRVSGQHAPFWEHSEEFLPHLEKFVKDCEEL